MSDFTIKEVTKYTGFTRQTVLKWLENGTIKGRKTGSDTSPWVISFGEIVRVAHEKMEYHQIRANKIKKSLLDMPGYNNELQY